MGALLDARDFLAVDVFNEVSGLVVNITARIEAPSGQITEHRLEVRPTSDRAENNASLPLSPGRLVSVSAHPTGATVRRGQAFIYAYLSRDSVDRTFPSTVLLSDYLVSGSGLGWPGSVLLSPLDGPGAPFSTTVADPGAGSQFTYTVPAGLTVNISMVSFWFQASSTVANRQPRIALKRGAVELARTMFFYLVGATSSNRYYCHPSSEVDSSGVGNVILEMPVTRLIPGDTIVSDFYNMQAGDNLREIEIAGESWLSA